eukprot:758003-Hanusia_phi.AAC.4
MSTFITIVRTKPLAALITGLTTSASSTFDRKHTDFCEGHHRAPHSSTLPRGWNATTPPFEVMTLPVSLQSRLTPPVLDSQGVDRRPESVSASVSPIRAGPGRARPGRAGPGHRRRGQNLPGKPASGSRTEKSDDRRSSHTG